MKTRGQKAFLNTIVLGLYEGIVIICNLILPRWILSYYGSTYNGIIASVGQFLNFITILIVGIGGATRFSLYKVLAQKDNIGISGIVNATERYMRRVGYILLGYIFILACGYPFIANTSLSKLSVSVLVLIVGAGSFAQYFFGITYQILLTADQKQYIYYAMLSVATVINVLLAVILMKFGCSIYIVKLGSATIFVLVPIILSIVVKKIYNIDKTVPPDNAGMRDRWDVMWHSVANIIHNNTDLVILTFFADIKLVSVYTVYSFVTNGLYKIISIFTSSLEAAFGNMFAKNEIDNAYKQLNNYEFLMYSLVSVLFSCALVLVIPFVKIYTTGITDVNYVVPEFAYVLVISQIVMCVRQPYLTVVQAAGHYKQTRNGAIMEAIINLTASIVLVWKFGLIGVATGTLLANLFRTLQYVFYLRKNILCRPVGKVFGMLLWLCGNICVIVAIGTVVISRIDTWDWLEWFVNSVLVFFVAIIVTVVSGFIFCRENLLQTKDIVLRNVVIKKNDFVNTGGRL